MGAVNSSAYSSSVRCSIRSKHPCCDRCNVCGGKLTADDSSSLPNKHHSAELCGFWIGKPRATSATNLTVLSMSSNYDKILPLRPTERSVRRNLSRDETEEEPMLMPLPERSVRVPHRLSRVLTSLLKSAMFMNTTEYSSAFPETDAFPNDSLTTGCHLHGCLFVDGGKLIFQAADTRFNVRSANKIRQRLSNLTSRKSCSTQRIPGLQSGTQHGAIAKNRSSAIYEDEIAYKNPVGRRRLQAHWRNSYALPPTTDTYRKHRKLSELINGPLDKSSTTTSFPLQISWPLVALRRFGFYGQVLFKLEAGRRAPYGEGHYLFHVESLQDFQGYFEDRVRRLKAESPYVSPGLSRCRRLSSMDSATNSAVTVMGGDRQRSVEQLDQQPQQHQTPVLATLPEKNCPSPFVQSDQELDVAECSRVELLNSIDNRPTAVLSLKKKANSLSTSFCRDPSGSTCQHWVQHHHHHHHHHHHLHSSTNPSPDTIASQFQSSCPQLTISQSTHHAIPTAPDCDEIDALPDPPPAPSDSEAFINISDCEGSNNIYDNILSEVLPQSDAHEVTDSRTHAQADVHLPTGFSLPLTPICGRLYTSRRAMTAQFPPGRCEMAPSHKSQRYHTRVGSELSSRPHFTAVCDHTENDDELAPSSTVNHLRHTSLPSPRFWDSMTGSGGCQAGSTGVRPHFHAHSPYQRFAMPPSGPPTGRFTRTQADRSDAASSQMVVGYPSTNFPYCNLADPDKMVQFVQSTTLPRDDFTQKKTTVACKVDSRNENLPISLLSTSSLDACCSSTGKPSLTSSVDEHRRAQHYSFRGNPPNLERSSSLQPTLTACSSRFDSTTGVEFQQVQPGLLYYATLDFSGNGADLPPSDHHSPPCPNDPSGSGSHAMDNSISDAASHETDGSVTVYGTLTDDLNAVDALFLDNRRRLTGQCPAGHRLGAEDTSELPSNYVAICQLQTLAMRAVLNATT